MTECEAIEALRRRFAAALNGAKRMTWETPELIEIEMSAEIGGYQGEDFGPDGGGEREDPGAPSFTAPTSAA